MTNLKKENSGSALLLVFGPCLAALVGFGLGHVGHDVQADQANKAADVAVKGKGSDATGPCRDWADAVCERMGSDLAYECALARNGSRLLSGSACVQAQQSASVKIDALKAARVPCSDLTGKLCTDLGPEGKGCELVTAKEPTLSINDCQGMTRNYRGVLAKMMKHQEAGTLPEPPRLRDEEQTSAIPN